MGFHKNLHSINEIYNITVKAVRTMPYLKKARQKSDMDQQFMERIMLTVTEVNGCEICSYAHTKMALEAGMKDEEIENMLAGVSDNIPAEQLSAIMFAQHYADTRGFPSLKSWQRVVEKYGLEKAEGILGATRMIMMGNVYGIPWSSFLNRLKGKPDTRSSLEYELVVVAGTFVMIPVALLHALILTLLKKPLI
ncbi:MAG: carboxymuconolactone decarboxylase family protein [Clostridium sp.]|nr:carboxymuconolactone decarboxylase family protein [Clostridium sp.]